MNPLSSNLVMNTTLVGQPLTWHLALRNVNTQFNHRLAGIAFFAGLTALLAQVSFLSPWSPVPFTFQTMGVLATGVYLRRNDAFASGLLYVGMGALGAPFFAGGGSGILEAGQLIPSAGYLLAFPLASAMVAEGMDRSHRKKTADVPAQLACWSLAMLPVYAAGTWWLSKAYSVSMTQAYEWGTEPFLIWDFGKILVLLALTTKVFSFDKTEN